MELEAAAPATKEDMMKRKSEVCIWQVVATTCAKMIILAQEPAAFFARLKSRFHSPPVIARLARNGLFVLLALVCVSGVLPFGAADTLAVARAAKEYAPFDYTAQVPDAAWQRVVLTATQQQQLFALRAQLLQDQLETLRSIGLKGELLRLELEIATLIPGQEKQAAKLRQQILRLTAPLQERHSVFVRQAKALLTAQQKQQLDAATIEVQVEQAAVREASKTATGSTSVNPLP